ncbi:MAG: CRISPR-associated protein Cas4 [Anaerovoracaceae bacterium]
MYEEDDYLLLSGIQHYAFCPRQWALIHIDEIWNESYLTMSGRLLHKKAHGDKTVEKRDEVITYRAVKICSAQLGLSGECDVVEFYKSNKGVSLNDYEGLWIPYPVEYKRGLSKIDDCDRLQLCAQAMCLEEMLCTTIEKGAIYYGQPRRREIVDLASELKHDVLLMVNEMHKLFDRKLIPKAVKKKYCQSCSIKDICLPSITEDSKLTVTEYIRTFVE